MLGGSASPVRTVAVVAWLCAAVGCAAPEPPVATVTVGVDRTAVPLGAPLDLRFRFDVAPDPDAGLSEDYRVFVHFLDDRGDLLWTEDHDPSVPTSQWQPGQSVEYERRIRIPMYPYIGESAIAVGLYSDADGARVPLAGTDLGQRAYRVASIQLDPQHESSFITYGEGWHPDEFSGDGRQRWRWTTGRSVLSFRNPGRDARLTLEFDGRPDMFDSPQRLSLAVGDRVIRELDIEANRIMYHVEQVSAADLGTEDFVELELQVDPTFIPSQINSEARDERELGIRVFYTFVEPL
jgi:hypothetical protein